MTTVSTALPHAGATTVSTVTLDGMEVTFEPGQTIYEIASRHSKNIPTLCYDPRLEPLGSCRLCIVEVEGIRNPVASCTTRAQPGMAIKTTTTAVEHHRRVLLEMVVSENPTVEVESLRGYASQELAQLVKRYSVTNGRFEGATSGTSNRNDDNPFILRDYDQCISCYRCVRVCAEQEGDHAINIMNRGFHTQIATEFNGKLKDSACTFCGQCVQTCPTGALADRKAMRAAEVTEPEKTRTVCPYCGVGCSVDVLSDNDQIVGIHPAMDGPANEGALCVKGQYAFDFVQHPDRLKTPYIRDTDGSLNPASWEEALDKAAKGFRKAFEKHGRHSIYGVASGRAPNEAAYVMQKFIRAGFGTHQIDNCSRA